MQKVNNAIAAAIKRQTGSKEVVRSCRRKKRRIGKTAIKKSENITAVSQQSPQNS